MMAAALAQAQASLAHGCPVGVLRGRVRHRGRGPQRARAARRPGRAREIACLRNAGPNLVPDMTLYTTLSPCQMCTGAILLFQIPRVVVGRPDLRR